MGKLLFYAICILLFPCHAMAAVVGVDIEIVDGWDFRYSSDKSEVAAKSVGFSEDDFEIVGGQVTIKKSIAETIAKKLLKTNDIEVVTLPWREAPVSKGKIAAVYNLASRNMFFDEFGEFVQGVELLVLNITSSETAEFMKHVVEWDNYDDGMFMFARLEQNMGFIPEDVFLTVFIKDGGKYDFNRTENGLVAWQIALVRKTDPKIQRQPEVPVQPPEKKGSGGCNVGSGFLLLLGVLSLLKLKIDRIL